MSLAIPLSITAGLGLMLAATLYLPPRPKPAPPICNHDAFHAELQAQSARLERLEDDHVDTRILAAFGGAKMRGPKALRVISCDGSMLPGSYGESAYKALRESGLCDPSPDLPVPELTRR
jgi:hypothetical protein